MALFSTLAQPVGALMRPSATLAPSDSLGRAARLLRESSAGIVPIAEEGMLVGIVSEASLSAALARGLDPLQPVTEAMQAAGATLPIYSTGSEALRRLQELGVDELPVVDRSGRLAGIVAASDLFPRPEEPPHLPTIGGMATPFGVYLTAGGVRGGAPPIALLVTGMMLSAIFLGTSLAGDWIVDTMARGLGFSPPEWAYSALPFLLFMLTIRFIPLSGTHAAEHMTVHAIEWGEPLEREVVRRMPRVHPRCGTNLAVAVSLFLGLAGWHWGESEQLRLLVAMMVTMLLWRPLGHFTQQWITTKNPTDAQLEGGIRAAKELIAHFYAEGASRISLGRRLLASGIFHVMAGSTLTFFLAEGIARLFGQTLGL